jgi:diacylglycerol kinase family enzyme
MDSEIASTLKTVCAAGSASEGFIGETNEELNQLTDMGLLIVAYAAGLLARRRVYKPTEKGRALCKQIVEKDVALQVATG